MDTHPIYIHCYHCEEEQPHSQLDPFLFPQTYRCMRCGKPRKWTADKENDND